MSTDLRYFLLNENNVDLKCRTDCPVVGFCGIGWGIVDNKASLGECGGRPVVSIRPQLGGEKLHLCQRRRWATIPCTILWWPSASLALTLPFSDPGAEAISSLGEHLAQATHTSSTASHNHQRWTPSARRCSRSSPRRTGSTRPSPASRRPPGRLLAGLIR